MLGLPIYGKKTICLAFEFGLVLSEVATKQGVTLTPEISRRAENIFLNELKKNGFEKTALNFVPLVLASFEVK
jgi:hypothetical protein